MLNDLWELLEESPVKEQIIWLDSCHSGELLEFEDSDFPRRVSGRRRFIIAASHSSEAAYERLDGKHGVLSGALIEGLNPDKLPGGEWLSSEQLTIVVREELRKYYQITKVPQSPLISNPDVINLIQGKENLIKNKSNENNANNDSVTNSSREPIQELAEMPSNESDFFGRETELNKLERMVLDDKCRLLNLYGMAGIGKTTLAMKLKDRVNHNFKYIIWKNLRLSDSFQALVDDIVKFLSVHSQEQNNSVDINNRINYLINYFQQNECLLILDDVTEILRGYDKNNQYRKGWEEFGRFIEQIIQNQHPSCVLLTSHKTLQEFNNHQIHNYNSYYKSIPVDGLTFEDVRNEYLDIYCASQDREEDYWEKLVNYYGGNPAALNIVFKFISDRYDGEISTFYKYHIEDEDRHDRFRYTDTDEEYDIALQSLPGRIYNLLEKQFNYLEESQKEIMYLLAIQNDPSNYRVVRHFNRLESVTLVSRESSGFSLVPMVRDYVINRLINTVIDEILNQKPQVLNKSPLLEAHAKDYIKEIQKYRILEPIKKGLLRRMGGRRPVKQHLETIISQWREQEPVEGYIGGNILNLLLSLGSDLTGANFSNIPIWSADLQNAELHEVNFTNCEFSQSTFAETMSCINSITFSPDGNYFAAGDASGNIRLWKTDNYKLTLLSDGESSSHQVWSVDFSPDGNILASAGEDKTIRLWDVKSGNKLQELNDDQCIYCIKFSLDKNILVSAGDKYIVCWDVDEGAKINKIDLKEVYSIAFCNRQTFVSGSQDGYVHLCDINSPQPLKEWKGHKKAVRCVAFCPNSKNIASGSEDGTIRLWKIDRDESVKTLEYEGIKQVWTVAFSSNGKTLASGSIDKNPSGIDEHHHIRLWNIDNFECLKILGTYKNGHKNHVRSVAFCPNHEDLLISGANDHAIKIWDINTGKCQKTIQGYTNRIWSVAFSPNGKKLVSGSEDNKIRIWNIQEGRYEQDTVITRSEHTDWVWSVVFNPEDGNMFASASEDNTICLWRLRNSKWHKEAHFKEQHTDRIRTLAFSPDGTKLASGGKDRKIILWDINNCEVFKSLDESSSGHTNRILSLAFSPNNKLIASGSRDKTIRLWNYENNEVKTLGRHDNQVHSVAWLLRT